MKASAILKSLSFRIPARLSASPAVAPLPIRSSFDQQISFELDTLQSQDFTSASWLLQALDAATVTQKITLDSLVNMVGFGEDSDRKVVDDYLDDSVELLDACNGLLQKMDVVNSYIGFLRVVLHLLDERFEPNTPALARAREALDSCEAIEKEKCSTPRLRRKLSQKLAQGAASSSEMSEILGGSKAVAAMVSEIVSIALSFKSKRGATWSSSLHELQKGEKSDKQKRSGSVMLSELRQTVMAASELRDQMKSSRKQSQNELGIKVEELKRWCGELEEGVKPLEGRVKELYSNLISVRMALLGMLSHV